MCEFCLKHGEGRTWYLDARNYSTDLIKNNRKFQDLLQWVDDAGRAGPKPLEKLRLINRVPGLGFLIRWMVTRQMKAKHFGQVLTLADVEKVFNIADVIRLYPCVCRQGTTGKCDERYCFALGSFVHEMLDRIPDTSGPGEDLTVAQALERARVFQEQGLVLTVWTLETPFIIGICSCRPGECLAFEMEFGLRTKAMFKGEYVAEIDGSRCTGCRKCLEACHFKAIDDRGTGESCTIRPDACYGCGLCARGCPVDAIGLAPRSAGVCLPSAF